MSLEVDVEQRLGTFNLDVQFASASRLTALFGPSGSGKSSVINLISGLARPGKGAIRVDGVPLVDTERGLFVPPAKRRVGYVFQDARLFPHLSVEANLRYGRWFAPKADRYAHFDQVVDMLDIRSLLKRRPVALSGGEKQRVSIGRALLASPRLILMDEPLSSLDDARKAEILPYLERLRDETKIPIVYVSHSISEVARLATDIVVLAQGKVAISGSAAEVLRRPDLLPMEDQAEGGLVIEATITSQDEQNAITRLSTSAGPLFVPQLDMAQDARLRVRLRSRDVMLATERPVGLSALNILPAVVAGVRPFGAAQVDVGLRCGEAKIIARITRQSCNALGIAVGGSVFAVIKSVSFDRPTVAPRS